MVSDIGRVRAHLPEHHLHRREERLGGGRIETLAGKMVDQVALTRHARLGIGHFQPSRQRSVPRA